MKIMEIWLFVGNKEQEMRCKSWMHAISLRHCHQLLENHWWLNNSFHHRPFSCCLLSDETCWFSFCTAPSACVLSLWPLRASRQLEVSAAALPSALWRARQPGFTSPTPLSVPPFKKLNSERCDTGIPLQPVLWTNLWANNNWLTLEMGTGSRCKSR